MPSQTRIQEFGDVVKDQYLHPESEPLSNLLNTKIVIHEIEEQTKDERTTTYLKVGKTETSSKWYYTQSGVIKSQCREIKRVLVNGAVAATFTKVKDYYTFK